MKRILPAIALIAALSMTACSGGGSDSESDGQGGDSGSQQEAEKTPEVTQLNEDQLKTILESTDIDGTSFKALDTSGMNGSDSVKALEDAEYEPAECKDMAMAALNASKAADGTAVAGMSSDNSLTAALTSFKDVAAAEDQMKTTSRITKECNDVKVKVQGTEMTMSTAGAPAFTSDSIVARAGNNIVNSGHLDQSDSKDAPTKTAEGFVKALQDAS